MSCNRKFYKSMNSQAGLQKIVLFALVVFVHNAWRFAHNIAAMSGSDFVSTILHVGSPAVYNACRAIDENDFGHVEGRLRDEYTPQTLRVLHAWTNKKPVPSSITLVTQLTFSRLSMLHDTCRRWPGKIAAVVCIPFIEGVGAIGTSGSARGNGDFSSVSEEELVSKMTKFMYGLDRVASGCSLDLELVLHDIPDRNGPGLSLYPVNAARNRALMLAKTDAVLLLDVDFLPSDSLVNLLSDPNMSDLIQEKRAYVVPAFGHANYVPLPSGTDLRQRDAYVLLGSKAAVVDAYFKRRMPSFYEVANPGDHGPTNYSRWATAKRPYDIEYEEGYEPYIMIAKKYVPWYDERFVGYYRNKVAHLEHMYSLGIQFTVHPDAYTIHRPHPPSSSLQSGGHVESGHFRRMLQLDSNVRRAMSIGEYTPVTTFSSLCPSRMKPNFAPPTLTKSPAGKWKREMQASNDGQCPLSHRQLEPRFYSDILRVDVQLVKQTALLHRALVDPSILGLQALEPYAITSLLFDRVPITCTGRLHYVDVASPIAPRVLDILQHRQNIDVFVLNNALDACNEMRKQVIGTEFATRLHCGPMPTLARIAFRNVLLLKAPASVLITEDVLLAAPAPAFLLARVSTSLLREQGTDELKLLESLYDKGYACTFSKWRLDDCDATTVQSRAGPPPAFSALWIPLDEFSLALSYYANPGCAWSTHILCF